MKNVICKLAWKLGITMCFCHSILIFKIIPILKIILVFKIMIVIRFQIWFLIKFKLQRREWVWLKLCFSHAKGLLYYKYRSQCMHKKRAEKTQEEAITRNPTKKINKKNKKRHLQKKQPEQALHGFSFPLWLETKTATTPALASPLSRTNIPNHHHRLHLRFPTIAQSNNTGKKD